MKERYLSRPIFEHLKTLRQMVFLVGPRQVGKTTLAQSMLTKSIPGHNFFNWDTPQHRKKLITQILPGKENLAGKDRERIVFDEIHKYPRWKNALKGLFDTHEPNTHWLVTGSAMLNIYRRGQDSLLGRYFTYHLAPFTVAECLRQDSDKIPLLSELLEREYPPADPESREAFTHLMRFGGFPEPLFRAEDSFVSRWRSNRLDRLINQDLASTEHLRHLPLVEQLMFLLPERVGNPLSLNNLREDLEVHFATIRHWIELLERVFYGFFVRPYSKRPTRTLKKEPKWYLWDWTEIQEPGIRFENLVAVHLLKYVHYMNDLGRDDLSLHYVRDKEKQEVDFVICRNKKPFVLIECKQDQETAAPALWHFAKLLGVKRAFQLVGESVESRSLQEGDTTIRILSAPAFLRELV